MDSFSGMIFNLLLWIAGLVAVVSVILYLFFVRIAMTSDDNMAPALLAGERIVIWRDAELGLSDIAVCKHPHQDQYVIGRVVATAGMTIATDPFGSYSVNGSRPELESKGTIDFIDQHSGHRLPMQWGNIRYAGYEHTWMAKPREKLRLRATTVKSGLYLLSDNRSFYGADSRTFGEVDPSTCLGQVFFRLQPSHPPRDDVQHGWMQIVK